MHVKRNTEARSRNHFCRRKAIIIVYVCSLSYPACKAHRRVICGISRSTIFFQIISNGTIFRKKVIEHTMCVLILSTTFV